jgi:DNA-binding NarL/FixJ family response regulator
MYTPWRPGRLAATMVEMHVAQPSAIGSRRARVLAVDDDPTFLALICRLVDATSELETIGEATSGERAVDAVDELRPDIVLMDVRMAGMGGIRATSMIKAQRPSTLVILISTTHPDELPAEADTCQADAIVWKGELQPRLLEETWLRHRGGAGRSSADRPGGR